MSGVSSSRKGKKTSGYHHIHYSIHYPHYCPSSLEHCSTTSSRRNTGGGEAVPLPPPASSPERPRIDGLAIRASKGTKLVSVEDEIETTGVSFFGGYRRTRPRRANQRTFRGLSLSACCSSIVGYSSSFFVPDDIRAEQRTPPRHYLTNVMIRPKRFQGPRHFGFPMTTNSSSNTSCTPAAARQSLGQLSPKKFHTMTTPIDSNQSTPVGSAGHPPQRERQQNQSTRGTTQEPRRGAGDDETDKTP